MAGGEDEAQEIVVERVVDRGRKVLALGQAQLRVSAELRGLALVDLGAANPVDGAMLGGRHEPGARVVRDTRLGPLLEGGDERLLA